MQQERVDMPETVTIPAGKLVYLEERARKLAQEKSYLQLVMRLINRVSSASGLEDTVDCMMRNILDVVGGTNIVLYYWIDGDIFSVDVYGTKSKLDAIDDELVQKAETTREPIEVEHDFSDTQMTTLEFGKAYTWAYPLLVGNDLVGVLKMESLHIGMRELYEQLPTFFNYTALVLRNEILGHCRLKQAYDQLNEMNEELEVEIGERELVEEELRQSRDELEKRVTERTVELKSQRVNQEEMIQQRTAELLERSRELLDNQQALMNIVDDLNQKTEELGKANSKLQDLDRLKSMFIAAMSHELRTPLNSIIGFSSILRDEWLGPVNPEQKENLDTIQRSGKHLLSLINDVIDVSKIEAGRIETRFEEFDLFDLLTEAVQYVEKDLRDKGLELYLKMEHHPLYSDRRRLLQCVINLLSNAVKFTEQGEVTLSSAVADIEQGAGEQCPSGLVSQQIDISVADSGIGIAEEDITRLFQPFERLESHLRTTAPGTGLGLYLTRKLVVEVLRGDILCKSKIGTGSTFTLRIPERI